MLRAAAVFSDHMVLQRNKRIQVFGEGNPGSDITVELFGRQAEVTCESGSWRAVLPPLTAASGGVMRITDGTDIIEFTDIAIGEVWLAGGQSNMELMLQDSLEGPEFLKNGIDQDARYYDTPRLAYKSDAYNEEERKSHWELFNREDSGKWSAVAFFFAKELAEKLGVTVGIIGCNWGGTSASAWMSREALLSQQDTESYVEEYNTLQDGRGTEEQIREYEEYQVYQADWDKRAALIYEKEPMMPFDEVQKLIGPCRYPGPMNCANFTRPSGLYESMLKRLMPYGLNGFIYYQGESDDHKPGTYYTLLSRLIGQWREDFEDDLLSFIIVQLPMHRYQHEPDHKNWCIIREAQMKAYKTIKNTGIAVVIDCGQFHEIHPKKKSMVGKRLALQALCNDYHVISEWEAFGPLYRDYYYHDGGIELLFDHAGNGFKHSDAVYNGFEIAGNDRVFYPAGTEFRQNTVFLTAPEVEKPVMARYLWTNYSEVRVFGSNGIPLAPFRTHIF